MDRGEKIVLTKNLLVLFFISLDFATPHIGIIPHISGK
jgi:hypothetical protein